jgi:hypothetical protein
VIFWVRGGQGLSLRTLGIGLWKVLFGSTDGHVSQGIVVEMVGILKEETQSTWNS